MGITVLGLLLLGWMFSYLRRLDWNAGPVAALVAVYFMVQASLPVCVVAWFGVRFNEVRKHSMLEQKRKAILQRRGLFDFVSPSVVLLAALSYLLFAAFVIYIRQHPFPGFAGLINIGGITLVYAIQAIIVHAVLYGKKPNPFETHAGRARTIGLVVKSCVYSCIAAADEGGVSDRA